MWGRSFIEIAGASLPSIRRVSLSYVMALVLLIFKILFMISEFNAGVLYSDSYNKFLSANCVSGTL